MSIFIFYFSIRDPKVVEKLRTAERTGTRVTLHYEYYLLRGWKYGSTDYNITDVEL